MKNTSHLEVLLEAAAADSGRIPEFLTALLEAQVLVPGVLDSDSGLVAAAGSIAGLAPSVRADGTSVQPFFTSEARLHETLQAVFGLRVAISGSALQGSVGDDSGIDFDPQSAFGPRQGVPSR